MNRRFLNYLPYGFASLLLFLVACVTLQETGQQVWIMTSPQEEAGMGAQAFQSLKKQQKISSNTEYQNRVKTIADRLIPHAKTGNVDWETVVFEEESANAFALPGGKIGVHTGMLKLVENDAQLASVMGHEIAHVSLRHAGQRFAAQFPIMLGYAGLNIALKNEDWKTRELANTAFGVGSTVFGILPFSREHEYQADEFGLRYMAKAGYDPREAVNFWRLMEKKSSGGKPPEFLSTHPSGSNRIARLEQMMPEAMKYYQGIQ